MDKADQIIIAINPGTRYVGFAIFRGRHLLDWGVSVINGNSPDAKLLKTKVLLSRFLTEYDPQYLVMKALHPSRQSSLLKTQYLTMLKVAQSHRCQVVCYSIKEIKSFFGTRVAINKKRLAALLCELQPALRHAYQKEDDALNPYHTRMFEAVALGMMCQKSEQDL